MEYKDRDELSLKLLGVEKIMKQSRETDITVTLLEDQHLGFQIDFQYLKHLQEDLNQEDEQVVDLIQVEHPLV